MANNTDLAAAIRLLAEKLTQERVERPETAGEMFERLAKDEAGLWWRENGARLSAAEGFNWEAFVCDKNHPGRDCKGDLVSCNYCQKKGHREYECFSKHCKDLKTQGIGNQVRSGSNQLGNQSPNPGGQQNNQGSYSKPANENPNQNKPAGKMFVMSRNEAERSADVVTGKFSIHSVLVKTLFDLGVTYSFISSSFLKSLGLVEFEPIDLSISIPTGEVIKCIKLFKNLSLKIGGCVFPSGLIEFNLGDLDVILGMNWLSLYKG
ncbi:uncharacterized protein LOC104885136 [Beta vulgaris subsp. vulgaris]|uniref:uncharacterized protein LOC104885136 n=1 Tax=Beta vulgaris subsp. vulgaris TaxID=3555 RepID=UPI00053F73F0|nr:uncharacterized protein LOC104885136 [Beta vulgaris subsp. vulgaris]